MDVDAIWTTIADERRHLADLLDGRPVEDWEHPSLCTEWRIRDVVGHIAVTPQSPSVARMAVGAIRRRFDFDALNRDMAREHAQRSPAVLLAELREHATDRSKPVVTTLDNLLFDTIVHVQDVALPLGVEHTVPTVAATAGLDRVWAMGWPFHARRRFTGMRLIATDADWTTGEGPAEVCGPAVALLLLMTRRAAALGQVDGPGAAQLRSRQF